MAPLALALRHPLPARGAAVGLDLVDTREEESKAKSPASASTTSTMLDPDRKPHRLSYDFEVSTPTASRSNSRDRLELDFEKDADWRLDTNLTLLSDEFYLRGFRSGGSSKHQSQVPDNTIGLFRNDGNSLLIHLRPLSGKRLLPHRHAEPGNRLDQAFANLSSAPQSSTKARLHSPSVAYKAADTTRRNIIEPLLEQPD